MTIGIVGLGLIGGSLAKAFKRREGITILGADRDKSILDFACLAEAVDASLTDENMAQCDVIFLATYPQGIIDWMQEKAPLIAAHTLVMDCGGTKARLCEFCFPLAKAHGFTFVGGHPMAGTHRSGFKYSREDLFDGAPMVIVPPDFGDIRLLERIKALLAPAGFGQISVTTAREHDDTIAFTSQMPHVVSNAFIKSPTARRHRGVSAGSNKDLTRVAWLNAEMWTELFMENRDALTRELDVLISSLEGYRAALQNKDAAALCALLEEGRSIKHEVDG